MGVYNGPACHVRDSGYTDPVPLSTRELCAKATCPRVLCQVFICITLTSLSVSPNRYKLSDGLTCPHSVGVTMKASLFVLQ